MKKLMITVLTIGAIFAIWMALQQLNDNNYVTNEPDATSDIEVSSEYSNGKITTHVKVENPQNITSTEFRYRTFFLDQYENIEPKVYSYSFPNYEEIHTYELNDYLLQGQKDDLEVEVLVNYDDGTQGIMKTVSIQGVKKKVYNDFVIKPVIQDDRVYYQTNGLAVAISKDSYNEEIIFYSNTNIEQPIISVGFQKDYALYPLKIYGVISEEEASKENFEGISPVEFTTDEGVDESLIVVDYGMIELSWDGLYPYDLDGNEVTYEGEKGETEISLYRDNQNAEVSKASHEKYRQVQNQLPNMKFIITR